MLSKERFKYLGINCSGYALVEVVVSVLVFAVIVLSVFRLFAFSAIQNHKTATLSELDSVAERSMEYLKSIHPLTPDEEYKELSEYTMDTFTKERIFVAYKVTQVPLSAPAYYDHAYGKLPTESINYNIDVEVCLRSQVGKLGVLSTTSKKEMAQEKGVLMVVLSSNTTRYHNK